MFFRRDFSVKVSGVVDHLQLVEDVSTRENIHCGGEDDEEDEEITTTKKRFKTQQ
jgi:hypothetical protein